MAHNPFRYGSPVEGDQFGGRTLELAAALDCMSNQLNLVVLSPRRYGKTSLLGEAESILRKRKPAPAIIHVDLFRCSNMSNLASKLVSQLYQVPGGSWRQTKSMLAEFLKHIQLHPTVTIDGVGRPVFGFAPQLIEADGSAIVEDVYRILEDLAKQRPAVLVLDEFQDVVDYAPRLPFLLKGLSDTYPHVSLVIAGSRRHVMEELVLTQESPLYGMAKKLGLGSIPDEEMIPYLRKQSTSQEKAMSETVARSIIDLGGPIPNDIQYLAHEAYEVATKVVDQAAVELALERILSHEAQVFEPLVSSLIPSQRRVLRVLAGESAPSVYSNAFAQLVELGSPASVRTCIDSLEGRELIVRDGRKWRLANPFLMRWLKDEVNRDKSILGEDSSVDPLTI